MPDTYTKGDTITLAADVYDDYHVIGVYAVRRSFTGAEVIGAWLALHPDQGGEYQAEFAAFSNWLVSAGYLKPITTTEFHIGSYATFDKERK